MTVSRGLIAGVTGAAVLVGAVAWAIGVPLAHSAFLMTVVATIAAGYAIRSLRDGVPLEGFNPVASTMRRDGARRDVVELSWSLSSRSGTVSQSAARRLGVVAERRLAHHGIDLGDPHGAAEAQRLLGTRAFGVVSPDRAEPIRRADFMYAIAVVEHLDDMPERVSDPAPNTILEPPR